MVLALLALFAHRFNSFWRLRAKAKSSSGVLRVFLIKPCSATRCSWWRQSSTRAVRFAGRTGKIMRRQGKRDGEVNSPLQNGRRAALKDRVYTAAVGTGGTG